MAPARKPLQSEVELCFAKYLLVADAGLSSAFCNTLLWLMLILLTSPGHIASLPAHHSLEPSKSIAKVACVNIQQGFTVLHRKAGLYDHLIC